MVGIAIKKAAALIETLVYMVLALLVIGIGWYLLFGSSAKASEAINSFTGCAEGVITGQLGEESACFTTNDCGTPPEGKKWLNIGRIGCNETHAFCCVLMDGDDKTTVSGTAVPRCEVATVNAYDCTGKPVGCLGKKETGSFRDFYCKNNTYDEVTRCFDISLTPGQLSNYPNAPPCE